MWVVGAPVGVAAELAEVRQTRVGAVVSLSFSTSVYGREDPLPAARCLAMTPFSLPSSGASNKRREFQFSALLSEVDTVLENRADVVGDQVGGVLDPRRQHRRGEGSLE